MCSMSDKGVESLARALADNRSLQELSISDYNIGDNGIAHIATALQTNNTLKELTIGGETTTDEGVLSLAAVLHTTECRHSYTSISATQPYTTYHPL